MFRNRNAAAWGEAMAHVVGESEGIRCTVMLDEKDGVAVLGNFGIGLVRQTTGTADRIEFSQLEWAQRIDVTLHLNMKDGTTHFLWMASGEFDLVLRHLFAEYIGIEDGERSEPDQRDGVNWAWHSPDC